MKHLLEFERRFHSSGKGLGSRLNKEYGAISGFTENEIFQDFCEQMYRFDTPYLLDLISKITLESNL